METAKEAVNPNPKENAGIFSTLFFGYTFPIFKTGYKKKLEVDDLYNPLKSDRSSVLGDNLERNWEKQLAKAKMNGGKPSLFKALTASFWFLYAQTGLMILVNDCVFRLLQPMVLGGLLGYFKPITDTTREEALLYAGGIVSFTVLSVMIMNQQMLLISQAGMKTRAAVCALMYRKALRLSKTALGNTAAGKIVNLLSNDVSRFDIVSMFIHQMWCAPLVGLIVMGLIYKDSGISGMIGVVAVFVIVPIQSYTGKLSAKYRKQTAGKTDERVRLMDEIISGVQVIKMYAWEKPFEKIIKLARKAEIKIITKSSYVRAAFMAFNVFTTRFAMFCTLLSMALSGQEITAAKVFVFQSYFNILSMTMGMMFVRGVSEVAEFFVGIKRIEDFLLNDEFESLKSPLAMTNGNKESKMDIPNEMNEMVLLKDLTAKFNLLSVDNALDGINLTVPHGCLLGIIGPVGSGKSSLLQTILGELEVVKGNIKVNGKISYASQEPWLFGATVRQNIVFGAEFDKQRYHDVVKACALEKDFEQFDNGDLTIVGDRGASLSGGQKARINLARAVYNDADIYLLDDPLSAVDIHVSKHLYEECINGYLSKKTRILVTHQVHYLKDADHIIILNNGRIEDEGTFKVLSNSDNLYAQLLTAEPEQTDVEKKENPKLGRQVSLRSRKESMVSIVSELSIADTLLSTYTGDSDEDEEEREKEHQQQVKNLQETSSEGKVKGSLLINYLMAGSNIFCVCLTIILFVACQLSGSGVDYFVSFWVDAEELRNVNVSDIDNSNNSSEFGSITKAASSSPFSLLSMEWPTETYLYIYGGGILTLFVIAMSRSVLFYKLAMLSSKKLHSIIFGSVVGAPMRFFDTNSGGRILNRFSKDLGAIDELLPKVILDAGQMLLAMAGALALIVSVNPYFAVLIAFLFVIFGFMRHVYLRSSKNIKRLEGIMRSPVFTHLKATIEGLTTIRAYGAHDILKDEFDQYQDYHTSSWYMFISTSCAFGFYLDIFCAGFTALLTFSFLVFEDILNMRGGEVGLAITQSMALTGLLQYGMRQSAEVANQLMSVERVLEYKELPKEIEPAKPQTPNQKWPSEGQIVFVNMGLRYSEDGPLVLRDFNLTIKPKEKVGIVGRTGAGKSSLISALFRLAPIEGGIIIDGVETGDIKLENLRSKISIIPQDPVLYSGTLRYNLDPFGEYSDEDLYKAIEDVELKDPANVINRLENRVMDRGANYSVGQRQLICLARAILKNNRILMLDEATANVDPQTDALIQKTIRRKFVDCTVLTVAHRLNTIMDSDKVLVMDFGTIVEFDHPHRLLQDNNGIFYKMVSETGKATADQLRRIASDTYQKILGIPE
ncbi:hypothetical protein JTB14_005772 [Gonioctena quinquepunctata]|nr:hypothetical protein JTB14_005772 [Gonioctena quinquepunctata]